MGAETAIVEAVDEEETINEFVEALEPFNITELTRTGKIVMRCGKTHRVSGTRINTQPDDIMWSPEQVSSYH